MIVPAAKAAVLFFFVTIVQVTIVSEIGILGGSPDLVLVTLVAVALTQGSIFGAVTGFWAGLLLDVARLGTLGFTSLLLTLAGFWIGRYGETTGRDRAHAPLLSVAVVTVLYAVGSLVMHFLLREPAPARVVLDRGTARDDRAQPPAHASRSSRSYAACSPRRQRAAPEVEFVG